MNTSSYHRQDEDWNKQSTPRATDKATTSILTRIDEDYYHMEAHSDDQHDAAPADRGRRPRQDTCATPTTRPPFFVLSRQNAMGEDGFNALCEEHHASFNDNEEELPMSLYLPNL
jgi:hypothetical protein